MGEEPEVRGKRILSDPTALVSHIMQQQRGDTTATAGSDHHNNNTRRCSIDGYFHTPTLRPRRHGGFDGRILTTPILEGGTSRRTSLSSLTDYFDLRTSNLDLGEPSGRREGGGDSLLHQSKSEEELTYGNSRGHKPTTADLKASNVRAVFAIMCIGFTVEFFWAVGEVVIMPLLELQGASLSEASGVMLLCPVLTLILHPLIGSWSDRMGRKIPMVTAALFGSLSLFCLLFQDTLFSSSYSYYFTIIAYGVSETAHDLLYTLGRALTHDHAADLEGGLQQITSEFSAVMKCGRLLGFLISVFHVEAILLQWNKDEDHHHDTEQRVIPANLEQLGCGDQLDDNLIDTALHSKILFGVVFFFWTASTIGVMLFVTDKKQQQQQQPEKLKEIRNVCDDDNSNLGNDNHHHRHQHHHSHHHHHHHHHQQQHPSAALDSINNHILQQQQQQQRPHDSKRTTRKNRNINDDDDNDDEDDKRRRTNYGALSSSSCCSDNKSPPSNNNNNNNNNKKRDQQQQQQQQQQRQSTTAPRKLVENSSMGPSSSSSPSSSFLPLERIEPSPSLGEKRRVISVVVLCLIEYGNWIMDTVFCFYFVIIIGETKTFSGTHLRVGSSCLTAQSLIALVFSLLLPRINAYAGSKFIWYLGNMSFCILCMIIPFYSNQVWPMVVLATATGFSEATRDNNVYIIMEKLTPKGNEGYYVALISNAMAAAQVTIGIFFGRITERYLDNDINNGFFYASVVSCVWISLVTLLEMSMGYIPEIYSSDD